MNRDERSIYDMNDRLPILPHESLGVECSGCLFVRVSGDTADIVCNECKVVIRTVQVVDVEAVMLEIANSTLCPHCGALNTFPRLSSVEVFICAQCGGGVVVIHPLQ
jgi:hypothetical protein